MERCILLLHVALLPCAQGYFAVSGMMRKRREPISDAKAACTAAVAGVSLAALVGCVDASTHMELLLQSSPVSEATRLSTSQVEWACRRLTHVSRAIATQNVQVHLTTMAAAGRLGQPAIMPWFFAFGGLNLLVLPVLPLLVSPHRYEHQASSAPHEGELACVLQDDVPLACGRAVFDDPEAGVFCIELPTRDGGLRWVCV